EEFWNPLKAWIDKRKAEGHTHVFLWGFVALADVGPLQTWSFNHINPAIIFKHKKLGVQDQWFFKLYGMKFILLDLAPLASTMSMGTVAAVGEFLTKLKKLEHPDNPDDHTKCLHKFEVC